MGSSLTVTEQSSAPNIVLILADNLGWGELGCYGSAGFRGAQTPRIDKLASEGLRMLNFNVESDCVPTRSALMTGRHPIRTGAMQSIPAGLPQGLLPWEITLGQLLGQAGYATGCFGKWHLGDRPGRYPHERGFDEWYGIPRTSNESMFTSSPGFDPKVVPMPHVMRGKSGEQAENLHVFDLDARRAIDKEIVEHSIDFIERNARQRRRFFAYVPITHLHFPTLPHPEFAGRTGAGDFADSVAEMDFRVGQIVDALERLNLSQDTLLMFGSDNGPEFRRPWRGTAGPWTGTYHTAMEGSLRVPFIFRWPGRIEAARTSNEIVHVTDLFPTLAQLVGAELPSDRPLDGIDQLDLLLGRTSTSAREGFLFYIKDELRAVKWRNWKMHLILEREPNDGPIKLESPMIFDLLQDPKEETDVGLPANWVRTPIRYMMQEFQQSLKKHPPIPPGAPDDYRPK